MIKLACNYYKETEELILDKSIDVDYFKFPSLGFQLAILNDLSIFEKFMNKINDIRPVLLHGIYPADNVCSTNFKKNLNIDIIKRILHISKTPGISIHFDANNNLSKKQIIKTSIDNLIYLKEIFKDFEFLSIENIDKRKLMYLTDPDVISEVVYESNINFLLDISHAFLASYIRNEYIIDYIKRLPLDKVYEIHINGWTEKNGDVMAHTKINDLGYSVLKDILSLCSPKIVTLEYGRDNDRIDLGCPIIKPNSINEYAKIEIIEQIFKIKDILKISK